MARPFSFTFPLVVHLRDLDGLGHANNAVYLTWLETARNRWVFEVTGKREVADFDFILAHTSIDFRSAASLYEEIEVGLRPARIGKTSWELEYEVRTRPGGRLLAEARSVQVSYDYAAGHPIPVPARLRAVLEAEIARLGAADRAS